VPERDGRLRIALLFGGRSAEHDVSRATAVSVARALDPARYDLLPVAVTTSGRWVFATEARRAWEAGGPLPEAFDADGPPIVGGTPVAGAGGGGGGGGGAAEDHAPGVVEGLARAAVGDAPPGVAGAPVDVVFPVLHGPYGEDGTVQGLLELAGVPYVGSGVVGSAVAMDKVMAKRAFAAAGLRTARAVVHRDGHSTSGLTRRVEEELGYPCFVKPSNMGSSVGVSRVDGRDGLAAAVELAARFDEWVVIEEAVAGREIEVAVLGDDPAEASVPGEIVPGADFYSYADKYEDGSARLLAPAPLDAAAAAEVRHLAVAAFEACRCEAMARVDFFYEAGGRGFLVNEVNTIPGFTPISMYPRLWAESGLDYAALVDRLIELALERHARRAARAGRQRG